MKVERSYANEARFVAHAREFVTDAIGPVPRAFLFDVQLMTSELVNNAILHAASECTVAVEVRDDLITVSVTDTGEGDPTVRDPEASSFSGRGLMIVAALSRGWGVDPASPPPGKTVWFTVERPPSTDGSSPRRYADEPEPESRAATETGRSLETLDQVRRGGRIDTHKVVLWSPMGTTDRRVLIHPRGRVQSSD